MRMWRLRPRPRPECCLICEAPLPPLTILDRAIRWILEPPPICRDVEACMARFRVRVGLSEDPRQ